MFFVTQMSLADRLRIVTPRNQKLILYVRNLVGAIELTAAMIQMFSPSSHIALMVIMALDLTWTVSLNIMFCYNIRINTQLSDLKVVQISGDTFLRSLLYSLCHSVYFIGFRGLNIVSFNAVQVLFHFIVFTLLIPRILMNQRVESVLKKKFSKTHQSVRPLSAPGDRAGESKSSSFIQTPLKIAEKYGPKPHGGELVGDNRFDDENSVVKQQEKLGTKRP